MGLTISKDRLAREDVQERTRLARARTLEIRKEQETRNAQVGIEKKEARLGIERGAGCTPETRRCASALDMAKPTRSCCQERRREILRVLGPMLDIVGARWWIDYGSVLGFVRHEGKFVPHDKDDDLGILAEDREAVLGLKESLEDLGFEFIYYPIQQGGKFAGGDMFKIKRSKVNATTLDIFVWNGVGSGTLKRDRYLPVDQYKGRDVPEAIILPARMGIFEGIEVGVPADPEALVVHRYGANWRTPVYANNDGVKR